MQLFSRKRKLKILFVSSEEAPFAKVGGLGEVMFSLPRALRKLGHDVRLMMPLYGTIDISAYHLLLIKEGLHVPTGPGNGAKKLICNVREFRPVDETRDPVLTYFLENQEYYELRSNVYGYSDDRIRFGLLSRGCLEFLDKHSDWIPDIIVGTDWMTGFLPNFLKIDYRENERLNKIASVFSIHNLASHGMDRNYRFIPEMERDDGHGAIPDFFDPRIKDINFMRRGIMYADVINTVSKTYAEEITTEEYGEGLDGLLRERRDVLFGILNGIDYEKNNPATDSLISKNFSFETIRDRAENKIALQKRFRLPESHGVFVAGMISRLVRQKGFSLFPQMIDSFLKETKAQIIFLGTGDSEIMDFLHDLETRFPDQVRSHLQYDATLPHPIFAGSDVVLIPSLFEPSGLTQMEAMRYGAIPVARRTGGLADTVIDFYPPSRVGNGFLFTDYDPNAFLIALTRAFVNWQHKKTWENIQRNAMKQDFSWLRSAGEYEKLFRRAIVIHSNPPFAKQEIPSESGY